MTELSGQLIRLAQEETGEQPNIDLALSVLPRTLERPAHDALALFALGRSVG